MYTFLTLTGLAVLSILFILRRGWALRQLALNGQPIEGKVVRVLGLTGSHGLKRHRLRYSFSYQNKTYANTVAIRSDLAETVQSGDSIALIYLPAKPGINALVEDVAQAKEALNKP